MPVYVRQAAIDSIISNRETLVIDAQLMQNGGMDVVDTCRVSAIPWFETPFVRLTVSAAPDPASAHPVGEDERVVIPPFASLRTRHASELSRPENDGIVE